MDKTSAGQHRIDWVDYAKGICIILVVMMHSTLGVEKALGEQGALNVFIDWARPFRMPDFFLISGLFLARRVDAPWRDFLDKKFLHFVYFYVLWMTIQFLFKGPGIWQDLGFQGLAQSYVMGFIEPFGTLWFIYLLPVFFITVRLTRAVSPLLVFLVAAVLEVAPIHTGWIMVDEFASRFVFFFAGYWLANLVFRFADHMANLKSTALFSSLFIWGVCHTKAYVLGVPDLPGAGLVLGFLGTAAVISAGVLLARFRIADAIGYLGANSIVVYLAFFLFMAVSRKMALIVAPELGADVISLGVSFAGVVGPVILFWSTRNTPLKYLFKRPEWSKLKSGPKLESSKKVWQGVGHDHRFARPQGR